MTEPCGPALSHTEWHHWQAPDRVLHFIITASPPEMQMAKMNYNLCKSTARESAPWALQRSPAKAAVFPCGLRMPGEDVGNGRVWSEVS